jgi:hypothetical protein
MSSRGQDFLKKIQYPQLTPESTVNGGMVNCEMDAITWKVQQFYHSSSQESCVCHVGKEQEIY